MKTFILIVICCAASLSAQTFYNFSVTNGLPDNHIKSIIQDQKGFIWFGTQNGLSRFDGYEFKEFKNDPDNPKSLSNNGIWILHEGKSGYIWIGTQNGDLNRYNQYKNSFEHWNICSTTNGENYISCLHEESNGDIWIGTYNKGLYRFRPSDKSIKHWQHSNNDINSLSNDFINAVISDNEGNLWIGTYSGLNKFNPSKDSSIFKKYFADKSNLNSLTSNLIWNITKSKINPDIFYIGTYEGLTILNSKAESFKKLLPVKNPVNQFSNSIGSVAEKRTENGIELWLGGYGGLIKYNPSTNQISQWHHKHKIPESLISEQINDLLMDSSGVIWIATEDGVSCLPEKILKFKNDALQDFSNSDRKIINEMEIRSITQSKNGLIFLGTTQGLEYIQKNGDYSEIKTISRFEGTDIWSLAEGRSNDLWIGTYGKGLFNFNLGSSKVKHFAFQSPTDRITPYNYVKSIYEDNDRKLWVGFWGGGLSIIDLNLGEQQIFRKETNATLGISFNDVWKIFQDSFGRIWIGTNGGGLNLAHRQKSPDEDKKGYTFIRMPVSGGQSINNNVLSICEQKNNVPAGYTALWIGTTDGLTSLEIKNSNNFNDVKEIISDLKYYTNKNGLANNVISEIVEDDSGSLWLTTNFGLSKFNIKDETFINFSSYDGLTDNNFSSGALIKSRDGFIYAGSNQGLNIFKPEEIHLSDFHRQIIFTEFKIQNKSVTVSDNSSLKEDISSTKNIELPFNQNSFTFYFSALDYNAPQLIDYSYLLDGFDKEWSSPNKRNYAAYTNLNPGRYILKAKATNSDKIWQEKPAELLIIINPPWWKTSWAYFTYVFFIIIGILAIRKFQINRAELRNELKMREFESKKHQELENLKSRFFANLSHEFRTPLMLIKGPVELLINKLSKNKLKENELAEQLKMINNNSRKLQKLIDQLLELSQLESASIPIKAKQENLKTILQGLVYSFDSLAVQKNISLKFNTSEESIIAWLDRDKLEKIINNLLSNAFKFTEKGGTVSVEINLNKITKQVEIKISDTGIGIPDDQIDKIFNRFYQVDDSSSRAYGGSGIGLALVRELVELHKWNVSVLSELNKGTEFTLSIPSGDYLNENEKIYEKISEPELYPVDKTSGFSEEIEQDLYNLKSIKSKNVLTSNSQKVKILLIEDSVEVRKYLSGLLKSWDEFTTGINDSQPGRIIEILEAENGEEGLKTANDNMPDLIISDIMMPYMDGIEFCRRIKTSWETSHIPVILLTAKASSQSKIEGLETGADDYLTKPFDSQELFTRVKNLLEQRRRLKEKFSQEIKIKPEAVTTTSLDNELLNKALSIAENNLSDSKFGIEAFAKEMAVSRTQLHRKLLAVTGLAPGEFLRSFRLKRAAQMLLEKRLSVTQIAFEVGFNSPSHFTKAFTQQFNCLPSEFESRSIQKSKEA